LGIEGRLEGCDQVRVVGQRLLEGSGLMVGGVHWVMCVLITPSIGGSPALEGLLEGCDQARVVGQRLLRREMVNIAVSIIHLFRD